MKQAQYVEGNCKNICIKENVTEEECKNNNKCDWEKTDKGYCYGEDIECFNNEEDKTGCDDQGKNCKWVELGNCFLKCEERSDLYECIKSNKCDWQFGYCTSENENGDSEECSKFNKFKLCNNADGCKWSYDNGKCFTKNGCDGESVAKINCDDRFLYSLLYT